MFADAWTWTGSNSVCRPSALTITPQSFIWGGWDYKGMILIGLGPKYRCHCVVKRNSSFLLCSQHHQMVTLWTTCSQLWPQFKVTSWPQIPNPTTHIFIICLWEQSQVKKEKEVCKIFDFYYGEPHNKVLTWMSLLHTQVRHTNGLSKAKNQGFSGCWPYTWSCQWFLVNFSQKKGHQPWSFGRKFWTFLEKKRLKIWLPMPGLEPAAFQSADQAL